MNPNLTEIIVISDRSGSMHSCAEEAQNGINDFLREQKEHPGEARLTFVEFDHRYNVLCDGVPIKDVAPYHLVPGGWTALYDAMGRAITAVGQRLANTPEAERPGLVVCVVSTDGAENSSREYKAEQISAMVKEQVEKYSWQFQFMGANIDAITTAQLLSIPADSAVNVSQRNIGAGYRASSSNTKRMRTASASGQRVNSSYSAQDRKDLM